MVVVQVADVDLKDEDPIAVKDVLMDVGVATQRVTRESERISSISIGLYRIGQFWVNFPKFFFRSLSTRDGFLTILKDDLAGFTPGTCVLTHISCLLTLSLLEEKCPFLCLYSALCIGAV